MDDPNRVRSAQRVGDLGDDARHIRDRERPARQTSRERFSLIERHRDKRLAFRLADFVNRADMRMVEHAGRTRLADESSRGLG